MKYISYVILYNDQETIQVFSALYVESVDSLLFFCFYLFLDKYKFFCNYFVIREQKNVIYTYY